MSLDLLDRLRPGRYRGEGLNHEGQPFVGTFDLRTALGGLAWSFTFQAESPGGAGYHDEQSLLAVGSEGELCLVSINTNDPLLRTYACRRAEHDEDALRVVFGWGDPADPTTFRCEITLEAYASGDLGYRYAWGLPGGAFADRSGVRLRASQER